MTRFVIETTTHVPIVRQRAFEAPSLGEACRLAVNEESWQDGEFATHVEEETFVTGIWENAERAYKGTARTIPDEFRERIQRKADLFDRLVVLLRQPAHSMGIGKAEFERWLLSVQAALAEADAINNPAAPGE